MKSDPSAPANQFNTLRNKATGLVYRPSACPLGRADAGHWRERVNPSLFDSPSTCVCENEKDA